MTPARPEPVREGVSYELMTAPCDQCLTTRDRIVSGERAAALVAGCRREDVKFICHKASIAGRNIACRGVHDAIGPCRAYRFARAIGVPVVEIDPETLEPAAPAEMNRRQA